ncbi:MAG TPA: hypothetical protein VGR30_04570 [Candidatus Binatia bacterium]|jgi:hypothetical protein|nr:hypothetical protein [Candidatus Binatia bacterium]
MKVELTVCYLATVVVLLAATCIAAAEEFSQSLPKIEAALGSSESTLAGIDVSVLSVQYREGKLIDNSRNRALKYVSMVRTSLRGVRSEARIYDLLFLVTSLRGLNSEIESLISRLQESRTPKALAWADAFSNVADSLSDATIRFEREAFQFTERVDSRLANCPR